MTTELIRAIEQRLEDLMVLDEELACQYESDLYYNGGLDWEPRPIVELFTPELLDEINRHIDELDR